MMMDEVQLMCHVESLQMQLSHLGPVHEKCALLFMQSLESDTLSERIMKLKVRRDHLQRPLPCNFHYTSCCAGRRPQ